MEQIYRKIGKRYIPIGQEFTGFPCDGIWLVQNGRQRMMCLIQSDEKVPIFALQYRMHIPDLCVEFVNRFSDVPHSWMDIATACCNYFARVSENKGE